MTRGPLETRIAALRGRVRRTLAVHGSSYVLAGVLAAVIALGLADYLAHLVAEVRLVALIGLAGLAGWMAARFVVAPLVVRFRDLDIAMKVERRWPGLNDRLASTLQFLGERRDREFDSPALRAATVRQTLAETESIDFREVVDPRPARRAMAVAALALAVGGTLAANYPDLARIGARRLFVPFGADAWPQATHLHVVSAPKKVARGEPFELAVAVAPGEGVPASAKVTYAFEDGETAVEAMRPVDGGGFRGRIESVSRSFTFSAAAGDDTAGVRDVKVEVVEPPSLSEATIRITYPPYTAIAPATLAAGNTQVKAVMGSVVEVSATANKPLAGAALKLGDALALDAVKLDPAGRAVTARIEAKQTTAFSFQLVDREGFRNRESVRYDLRVEKDEPPRVVIDEPAGDRDVTAGAVVPVRVSADDDYGLRLLRLVYKVSAGASEPAAEVVIPLWDSPADAPRVKQHGHAHSWELAPLKLPPGSVITYHADALDFDDVKGPNLGRSRELRLRIVTPEEFRRQLDDQRREIREDVERALRMQEQALRPVEELRRTLDAAGKVPPAGREDLKTSEMIQRQLTGRIASPQDGLGKKIDDFLRDLKNSKVDDPDGAAQMQAMKAGVDKVREDNLTPAEQGLNRAAKALDDDPAARDEPDPADPAARNEANRADRPARNEPNPPAGKPSTDAAKSGRPEPGAKPEAGGKPEGADPKPGSKPEAAGKPENSRPKPGGQPDPAGKPEAGGKPESGSKPEAGSKSANDGKPEDGGKPGSGPEPEAGGKPEATPAKQGLAQAEKNQKAIADELRKMRDALGEFDTAQGIIKEAGEILKAQEQVMKQAADAAEQAGLMGKKEDELTPENKAALQNLGERQNEVARDLQGVLEKMDALAEKLDASDPLSAAAMKDAAAEARKKGTAGKMGDAADKLAKNQMGSAREGQESARDDLKSLLDSLRDRRNRELSQLVRELKEAEKRLADLNTRQAENLRKTREAKAQPDAKRRADDLKTLAKEQGQVKDALKKELQKLSKLRAQSAAQAGEAAAEKMAKAQDAMEQDEGDEAEKDEEEALADLQQAQEEVAQARKEAEDRLADEQLAKMADGLKALSGRQDKVVAEIDNYEKLRKLSDGKLTRGQVAGVRDVAAEESAIKDQAGELAERLDGAPAFALTLRRAAEGLDVAAQRLQALKTDEETRRAAAKASDRVKQMIDALKPDKAKPGQGQQQGGGEGGDGGGGGDGIPPAAQIKILKMLQQEINERTEFLDDLKSRNTPLTGEQATESEKLKRDQGALADIVRDLTKPKKQDGED